MRVTPTSQHRVSYRALSALVACLVLLLAGCGGAAQTASAPGGGGRTPVTFLNVLPIESLTFTPEIMAQAGGHFEREGLDVQFQVTRGSAQAIQTVIAGSALLTRVSDTEMMVAVGARGAPIRAVGQPSQHATIRIVSAADDPIRAPADMRGHMIGIPSEGGTSETLVDTLAATAGLTDADVRKQVVGLAPGVYELVKQGRIDAYVVALDTAVAVQRQQPDAVVLDPSQVIAGGTQVYITSQAALADPAQRDVVARFLRAVQAAQQQVIADQPLDTTLETLGDAYDIPILREPEVAKETLREYIASWQAGGGQLLETSPDGWARVYDESVAVGLVPGGLDASSWFTNELVPGAAS
jgi:ABC-type nitrate/sulfonate/bicarbonate transport system substrate-binding protein